MPRNDTRPSPARLATILSRQDPPAWGSDYLPGQLGTKEEAPDASRPGTFTCAELGRDVHYMGTPERAAQLVGFYSGMAQELHEGRMIPRTPTPGPLTNYKPAIGQPVLGFSGTIEVADRLGCLKWHPTVKVPDKEGSGKQKTVAYPLLGDLLWFFHTGDGIRAVNWTVKDVPEAFDRPFAGQWPQKPVTAEDVDAASARSLIEAEAYQEVDIPTVKVTLEEIPKTLRNNLLSLYKPVPHACRLDPGLRKDFIDEVRVRTQQGGRPLDVMLHHLRQYGWTMTDYHMALLRAIWTRELKVDLTRAVCVDAPLQPERKTVIEMFPNWFSPKL